jgi:hypothetical protein
MPIAAGNTPSRSACLDCISTRRSACWRPPQVPRDQPSLTIADGLAQLATMPSTHGSSPRPSTMAIATSSGDVNVANRRPNLPVQPSPTTASTRSSGPAPRWPGRAAPRRCAAFQCMPDHLNWVPAQPSASLIAGG